MHKIKSNLLLLYSYLDRNTPLENTEKINDGARIEQRKDLTNNRHATHEDDPNIEVDDDVNKEFNSPEKSKEKRMMNIVDNSTPVVDDFCTNEQQIENMKHFTTNVIGQQSELPEMEINGGCNDVCNEVESMDSPRSWTIEPCDDFAFQANDFELNESIDKTALDVSHGSNHEPSFRLALEESIEKSGLDISCGSSDEPSFRLALDEAYSDLDKGLEHPTLEFEENWESELYDVKSPDVESRDKKHKIVIRDLSFDENPTIAQQLSGIDLLCPVFLAVTEDSDDDDVVLKDIRRKTKSIENLCSALDVEQGWYISCFANFF